MYREHVLGALIRVAPEDAKAQILEAYRRQDGLTIEAAVLLGVTRRTLQRWVKALELGPSVDRVRKAAGVRQASTYNPGGMRPGKCPAHGAVLVRHQAAGGSTFDCPRANCTYFLAAKPKKAKQSKKVLRQA